MRGPKATMSSAPSQARLKASNWNNGMSILCRTLESARVIWFIGARFCRVSATSFLHRRLGACLSLIGQHPPRVFHRQCADLVQLLDFRIVESNLRRANIVAQLIHGFCADDHSGHEWLGQE